ncbi:uncharacterized protein [Haliotis cracherodii]|uniref:uncharacterized protein n=1 Tax=Haliotis cracherodii TaxID=6455 RepID=UPI0039EB8BB2
MKTEYTQVPYPGGARRLPDLFTVNTNGIDDAGVDTILDMTGLSSWKTATQNVNLSLSKKGRWKIIESLKKEMESDVYNEEEFTLYVVERLWINGAANCESITGSKSSEKTYYGGSYFFNADEFLRRPKDIVNGKRKKKAGGDKSVSPQASESDIPSATPEIRIEVVQPHWKIRTSSAPVTTRRRRRRAEYNDVKPIEVNTGWQDWSTESKPKTTSKPKSENKKRLPVLSWDSDHDVEPPYAESQDEDENNEHPKFIKDVEFEELFVKSLPCTRRKRTLNPRNVQSRTHKGKIIYTDKDEFAMKGGDVTEANTDEDSDSGLGTTEVIGETNNVVPEEDDVTVVFKPDDVAPEALTAIFGERYVECACHPRRFLLVAIREVPHLLLTPHINSKKNRSRNEWDRQRRRKFVTSFSQTARNVTTTGFLLFEEKDDGKFSFRLETDADLNKPLWMGAAQETENWSPSALVDCMCDLLQKHTSTSTRLKPFSVERPSPTFPTLSYLLSWPKTESYLPSTFPAIPSSEEPVSKVADVPDCCNVCYDVIDMSSRNARGMALAKCGHWFCHTCWKGHVTASLESGSIHMTCPEFACNVRLDVGTMTSVMSMRQLKVYMSRLDDVEVESSGSKSWCPRPGCTRIVSVPKGGAETGCVQCSCGATFCVHCHSHPHWPAACSNLARYTSDMKHFNDYKLVSWLPSAGPQVKGKRCPKCKHFIQKNGGCPNMVCRCDYSFCWQCLEPWDNHINRDCYSKKDDEDSKLMQEAYFETISERPESRSPAYLLALRSRRNQQVAQGYGMARHVTKMKRKLKVLAFRHRRAQSSRSKYQPLSERKSHDLEELSRMLEDTDMRGGSHLLDWALNLIFEVHHVIEYTAVLVDQTSCSPRLYQMVKSLGFLVSRMEQVFQDGVDQKVIQVPAKLTRLGSKVMEHLMELRAQKLYQPLKVIEEEVTS